MTSKVCRDFTTILLGSDWQTRVRAMMSAIAGLLSVLCGLLVVLLGAWGYAPLRLTVLWLVLSIAFNLAVFLSIRFGMTRSLEDPALTQLQVRFAIASNAVGYAILGDARGLTPVILSMVLMFGVLRLSPADMRRNLTFSLLCFGAAFAWVAWVHAPGYSPVLEFSYGLLIVLVLLGSTFLGMRVQHVRLQMKQQKTELNEAFEQIRHLAAHDELTGLTNRRSMTELLESEQARCERTGRPFMAALLDLDLFKRVNDEHGHAVGDALLQAFANVVQLQLRSTDQLARWGGEEFLLLMPETDERGAVALLQRVLESVATLRIPVPGGEVGVTVSAGIAAGTPGEALPRVLECADQALYDAKAQGRARVVAHPIAHRQTDADSDGRARELARRLQPVANADPTAPVLPIAAVS